MPCNISIPNELGIPSFSMKVYLGFLDDILVYNLDEETHWKHLAIVFNTLEEHSLYNNWKKCVFARIQVEYLGHWISVEGVEADTEKIKGYGGVACALFSEGTKGISWIDCLLRMFCDELWNACCRIDLVVEERLLHGWWKLLKLLRTQDKSW